MTDQYIIEIKDVCKFFGEKVALDHINLNIKKGEFVTILGPSGCGKTTLLRLLAGFQTASEGNICISGKEITQTPPHKRPANTVFQKLWSTLSLKKSSVTIIPSVTGNGKKGNRSNKKPALFRNGNTDGYTLEQFFYTICFQEYIRFFHQCITRHICRVLYEYRNGS